MRDNNKNGRLTSVLLYFTILTLFFSSCKKNDQTTQGGYLMKFDVNGKTVEFTNQASLVAAFSSAGSQFNALFTGYDATSNVGLQIFDSKAITSGTYTGYTIVGSALVGVLIHYQEPGGTVYTQATTNSDCVITISEMTATTVRGTFSGTLQASGKSDISVTNGQFFVWRAN